MTLIEIVNSDWFEELANVVIALILAGFAVILAKFIVFMEFHVIRPLIKRYKQEDDE